MTASWTPSIDPATGQPVYIEPMIKQVPYGYQQQPYQQQQPPQQQYFQAQGQYMPPQQNQFNQPQQQPPQQQLPNDVGVSDIVDKFIGMHGTDNAIKILEAALNIAKAKRLKP